MPVVASLAITIAVYDTNETALGTDKLPMAELKWMGPALAAPETLSAQFSAPANTPSFAWQQAVKFESIDPQTRLQVLEELHQLYALLVAGDEQSFAPGRLSQPGFAGRQCDQLRMT